MTSTPQDHADDADLAEQQAPLGDEQDIEVREREEADEGDLLEQATPVPDDEDDHRG
jgi:hypothetical protein